MTYKHKITGTQAKLAEDGKYYIHDCSIGIPKQSIEDSKVWFKEDGYEILSFKINQSYIVPADTTAVDSFKLKIGFMDIYSIKRLSDGEVIKIGDKVKEGIIIRLRFVGDIYQYSCVEQHGWQSLEKAVKLKEAVLVTEDGVELFENDTYYSLGTPDDYWRIQKHSVGYMEVGGFSAVGGDLIFAKKENIENYIKENKKKYSLSDISEAIKHWKHFEQNCQRNEFNILKYLQNE